MAVHPACRSRRRRRRDGLGAARRRRRARDGAADARRARRAARARDERRRRVAVTDEHTPIVLPDDPEFGPDVQLDYPGYRSTRWRAPDAAARHAPRGVPRARGPGLRRGDARRERQRPDPAARGRPARRTDHRHGPRARRGRPAHPQRAHRGVAGERRRPLPPRGRPASRAARPELLRRGPLSHRRRRRLPLRHRQARRVPVGQPRERVAARAHPLLDLRAAVHPAARDADVLPRRPAVRIRPDLQLRARPESARAPRCAVRPRDDAAGVGARLHVGHRPRPRAPARRRSTHDAAAHAVADSRALLHDRALPSAARTSWCPDGVRARGTAARRAGRAGRRRSDRDLRRGEPAVGSLRHRRRRPLLVHRRRATRRTSRPTSSRAGC